MRGLLLALPLTTLVALSIVMGVVVRAPVLAESAPCYLPCWNSIIPEQTSLDDAGTILMNTGYTRQNTSVAHMYESTALYYHPVEGQPCEVALLHDNERVTATILTECNEMSLGDVMAMTGQPREIIPSWTSYSLIYIAARERLAHPLVPAAGVTALTFPGQSTLVTLNLSLCETRLSPQAEVLSLHLDPALEEQFDNGFYLKNDLLDWRGFVPYWRYNRMVPGSINC